MELIIGTVLPSTYTSLGASKKISEATTIKVSVEDPFYIYRFKQENALPDLQTSATFRNSTQSIALAYTYNFGKSTSKAHEVNETDESKRIK